MQREGRCAELYADPTPVASSFLRELVAQAIFSPQSFSELKLGGLRGKICSSLVFFRPVPKAACAANRSGIAQWRLAVFPSAFFLLSLLEPSLWMPTVRPRLSVCVWSSLLFFWCLLSVFGFSSTLRGLSVEVCRRPADGHSDGEESPFAVGRSL